MTSKPTLFSGAYSNLTGTPTIPTDIANLADATNLLFDGTYSNLTGAPTLGNISSINTDGNASNVLYGNGVFAASSVTPSTTLDNSSAGDMDVMTYDGNLKYTSNVTIDVSTGTLKAKLFSGNGSSLTSLAGANVTGTVANATIASSANSVAWANVSGKPTIATFNQNLNTSNNVTFNSVITNNVHASTGTDITVAGGLGTPIPSGIVFNGTEPGGGYMVVPSSSDWALGTVWTIEFRIKITGDSTGKIYRVIDQDPAGAGGTSIGVSISNGQLTILGTAQNPSYYPQPTINVWTHIAIVNNNTTQYVDVYYDGVLQTNHTGYGGPSNYQNTNALYIGKIGGSGDFQYLAGVLSGIRISKVARYTQNFTLPTEVFASDSDTLLLMNVLSGAEYDDSSSYARIISHTNTTIGTIPGIGSAPANVVLSANALNWTFDTNGTLHLPGNNQVSKISFSDAQDAYINQGMGELDIRSGPGSDIQIQTDGGSNTWSFGADGNLNLPQGTILSETANSTAITPPNALAGQSLVVRLTGAQGISSDHPGGFTDGDTITITIIPDYNLTPVTGTVDYTFTDCTQQQLGRALTGTLTFTSEPSKQITWTIPVSSTMTTFTITLSNASGFSIAGLSPLTLTTSGSTEDHHIHLIAGDPSITDIYLGDDDQYVKIERNGGNVLIGTNTNTKQWTFDTSGGLTLPGQGKIVPGSQTMLKATESAGIVSLMGYTGDTGINVNDTAGIDVWTNNGSDHNWNFGADGTLTLPGGSGVAGGFIFGAPGEGAGVTNGGTGYQQFFVQDDGAYVQTSVNNSGTVFNTWQFGLDGNLTLPHGGVINEVPETVTLSGTQTDSSMNVTYARGNRNNYYVLGGSNWSIINDSGTYRLRHDTDSSNYMYSSDLITWTLGPAFSGDIETPSTGALTIGSTKITSKDKTWSFKTDGNITLPTNTSKINYANGTSILSGISSTYANSNVANYLPTYTGNINANIITANIHASPINSNLTLKTHAIYNITTITNGGTGYGSQSGTSTSGGSGTGMTVNVNQSGTIVDLVIVNNPGTGYVNGDTITILGGSGTATFTIANYSSTDTDVTNNWIFNKNGNLSIPGGGSVYSVGAGTAGITANATSGNAYLGLDDIPSGATLFGNAGVQIGTNVSVAWNFTASGNLTLPTNTAKINYANGVSILDGISGGASTGNITFDGDNIGSSNDVVNIVGNNYAQLESHDSYIWVEETDASVQVNGYQWIFHDDAILELANGANISQTTDGGGQKTFNITPPDTSDFEVVTVDGDIRLQTANSYGVGTTSTWTFDAARNLTLPHGGVINEIPDTVTLSGTQTDGSMNAIYTRDKSNNNYFGSVGSNWSIVYASGTYGLTYIPQSLVYMQSTDLETWTVGPTTSLDIQTPSTGVLTIGSTKITSKDKTWSFGTDGNLTLPANGNIVDSNNKPVIKIELPFDIKATDFNATIGGRYGVDTTSNTVTATLPISPSTGDAIYFVDAGGAYATNNLVVARNGHTIMGLASDMTVSVDNQSFGLFYNGTTWRVY